MNLIKEYAIYSTLIEIVKNDIESIQESNITLKDSQIRFGKLMGSMFHQRLKQIESELRKSGMWVRYEHGDSVCVIVGGRERHVFSRSELELDEKLNEIVEMIEQIPTDKPYKVEVPDKDPYA